MNSAVILTKKGQKQRVHTVCTTPFIKFKTGKPFWVCIHCVKTYQITDFKYVQYIVCQLYFSKSV